MIELSEEDRRMSIHIARSILDAFNNMPVICGVAALISVIGSVCYHEAEGNVEVAKRRASTMLAGALDVIDKLHQEDTGNGDGR